MERIRVLDSHTEGEPTRVVVGGLPDLGGRTATERLTAFGNRFDDMRSALVNEPRGNDAIVGALLLEPAADDALAQVIYFNNVGTIGMCVHGTIGVAATLRYLGRADSGTHRLETPVGDVRITFEPDGAISVENVLSFRLEQGASVETRCHGTVSGDIAWGGNWFFLITEHDFEVAAANIEELTGFTWDVRQSLRRAGITGDGGVEIDHVEVFGPPRRDDADSKNFVLCPGKAYDRSPCGTGTSAKLACLAADGKLREGEVWRQESTIGSLFVGRFQTVEGGVIPTITGHAWMTGDNELLLDPDDPFRTGIRLE